MFDINNSVPFGLYHLLRCSSAYCCRTAAIGVLPIASLANMIDSFLLDWTSMGTDKRAWVWGWTRGRALTIANGTYPRLRFETHATRAFKADRMRAKVLELSVA